VLVAATACPCPPLLVPELATGAAAELDHVRAACQAGIDAVWAARPTAVYVVGADLGYRARSFGPWGVEVAVDVPEPVPLSLLVGGWLTRGRARSFVALADELRGGDCAQIGAELASSSDRVGLLVMGDGSARHSEKAPGYLDERSAPYDDAVTAALAAGDPEALGRLDDALGRELLASGRGPWSLLAGAAPGPASVAAAGFDAPYGVGYHWATWTWQEPPASA
jgi:hypothetical protein